MPRFHEAWLEHQRKRWLRHDAHRFSRPDVDRYSRPDTRGFGATHDFRPGHTRDASQLVAQKHDGASAEMAPALVEAYRSALFDLKALVAELQWKLALRRFARKALHPHHSQFQPRVPEGQPGGGQFAPGGTGRTQVAQLGNKLPGISGAGGGRGGHHYMPRAVYKKYPLSEEAYKVFNSTTSGRLETQAIGRLKGHFWDGPEGAHAKYNDAVEGIFKRYLATNDIRPERMTSEQATSFLKELEVSEIPLIRDYNYTIRLLRMLNIFRGRGNE